MKTTPMKQQELALEVMQGKQAFALFMDPGLGKTKTIIDEVVLSDDIQRILVICPKSITTVWVDEIKAHSDDYTIFKWGGKQFEVVAVTRTKPEWYIINIDIIDKQYNLLSIIEKDMVVIDESTTIKKVGSKRTQAAIDLGEQVKYRRILTGTPIANTPLDLHGQIAFLDWSAINNWSFDTFRSHFCVMGGYKDRQIMGYRNLEKLVDMVAPICFRASKEEYLSDLPERTTQIREVELSKQSWAAYKAIVEEMVIELDGQDMPIDQVMKKITKLRQLTGGWILGDDKSYTQVGKEKLTELLNLLGECGSQKVLIWCQFVHEIKEIVKAIPGAKPYYGAMNDSQREAARNNFQILVIQNDTGSMGLTLNEATVSIFYSNPSYPLPKQQARERNHRKGQTLPVTEYELIVEGSVDQTILDNINNKRSLADLMMGCVNDPESFRQAVLPSTRKASWKGRFK